MINNTMEKILKSTSLMNSLLLTLKKDFTQCNDYKYAKHNKVVHCKKTLKRYNSNSLIRADKTKVININLIKQHRLTTLKRPSVEVVEIEKVTNQLACE